MDDCALTALYRRLSCEAPAIALRELLEAAAGRKCSRVEVGAEGVRRLRALAVEFCFGVALGRRKVIVARQEHKGDWSDGAIALVGMEDPRGLFPVYLGPSEQAAATARDAEEELGDDAFGELLGIPACCRNFYRERRAEALAAGDDYLSLTIDASGSGPMPAGANVVAQYFDAALLGHYPCTLHCDATRKRTARTLSWLREIAPPLAARMEVGHRSSYVVVRDRGMIRVHEGRVAEVVGTLTAAEANGIAARRELTVEVCGVW